MSKDNGRSQKRVYTHCTNCNLLATHLSDVFSVGKSRFLDPRVLLETLLRTLDTATWNDLFSNFCLMDANETGPISSRFWRYSTPSISYKINQWYETILIGNARKFKRFTSKKVRICANSSPPLTYTVRPVLKKYPYILLYIEISESQITWVYVRIKTHTDRLFVFIFLILSVHLYHPKKFLYICRKKKLKIC